MKIILLTLSFCAVINTAIAQNTPANDATLNDKQHELTSDEKNAVSNIIAFKDADTFLKYLNICGLVQTFNNPGPLTVFLPPDSAFNKLSPGKRDTLLSRADKFDLIALITYHALPGKVSVKNIAKEIAKQKGTAVFRTISGAPLKAKFDEYRNIVLIDENGGRSTLQKADIKQKNGMLHIVSAVLMPRFKAI